MHTMAAGAPKFRAYLEVEGYFHVSILTRTTSIVTLLVTTFTAGHLQLAMKLQVGVGDGGLGAQDLAKGMCSEPGTFGGILCLEKDWTRMAGASRIIALMCTSG